MSARWRYLGKVVYWERWGVRAVWNLSGSWRAGKIFESLVEDLIEIERIFEDIWGGTLKKKMNTSSREALFGNHFWQVKLLVSHAGQISASRKLDRYLVHAGAYSFNCSWIHENIGSIGMSYWTFWIFNIPSKILVLFFLFEKYIYLLSLNRFLS